MRLVIAFRFAEAPKKLTVSQEINLLFCLHIAACTKEQNIYQKVTPSLVYGITAWNEVQEEKNPGIFSILDLTLASFPTF
jgi:hypothetical protein